MAIDRPELADDSRFDTGPNRIRNRVELVESLAEMFAQRPAAEWLARLDRAGVPVGMVNDMEAVFKDPQIQSREMVVQVDHPTAGKVKLLANPIRFSATPVTPCTAPPLLGADTDAVLRSWIGLPDVELEALKAGGVV